MAKVVKEEAVKEEVVKEKEYKVTVNDNPEYCGIGAGGVQFANGEAITKSERMADWFRENEGYTVEEI